MLIVKIKSKEVITIEIGSKISEARGKSDLTQNELADILCVSRQSVSNWENNRAYPDIISIIRMSDIFKISLDSLLKDDEMVLNHLDKTTNLKKNTNKYIKLIELSSFIFIWIASATVLYLTHFNYSTVNNTIYFLIMPLTIIIISALTGGNNWGKEKIILPYFFGIIFSSYDILKNLCIEYSFKLVDVDFLFCSMGTTAVFAIFISYVGIFIGDKIYKSKK